MKKYIKLEEVDAQPMTVKEAKLKGYKVGEYADDAKGFEVIGENGIAYWKPESLFNENYQLSDDEEIEIGTPFSDELIHHIYNNFVKAVANTKGGKVDYSIDKFVEELLSFKGEVFQDEYYDDSDYDEDEDEDEEITFSNEFVDYLFLNFAKAISRIGSGKKNAYDKEKLINELNDYEGKVFKFGKETEKDEDDGGKEKEQEQKIIPFSDDFVNYILEAFKKGYGEQPIFMKSILELYKGSLLDFKEDDFEKFIMIRLEEDKGGFWLNPIETNLDIRLVPFFLEQSLKQAKEESESINKKEEEKKK